MAQLPQAVRDAIQDLLLGQYEPAWLRIDADLNVAEGGGSLARYGLDDLRFGQPAEEQVVFVMGMLPLQEDRIVLPCVSTSSGTSADLHLVRRGDETWLLFLDVSELARSRTELQQASYDSQLSSRRHARDLRRYLGRDVADLIDSGQLGLSKHGERREITVLFADLCGFTSFAQSRVPEVVFSVLNAYLGAMIKPVMVNGGMIDKLMGDCVMGLFGVAPLATPGPQAALHAAVQMIEAVDEMNRELMSREDRRPLAVSIGIATGPVSMGVLGSFERRSFSVIGHHVNLAARLEGEARAGEVLMDEASWAVLGPDGEPFTPVQLQLKGLHAPIVAYGCRPGSN